MIRLENLTKEYDLPSGPQTQIVAADALNLEIPAKEIFGLVGPNGAGKTTTLKMICGLLAPTAGRVTVNGIDVKNWFAAQDAWILALAMRILVAGLFAALQRRRLLELGAGAAPIPAPVAAGD